MMTLFFLMSYRRERPDKISERTMVSLKTIYDNRHRFLQNCTYKVLMYSLIRLH